MGNEEVVHPAGNGVHDWRRHWRHSEEDASAVLESIHRQCFHKADGVEAAHVSRQETVVGQVDFGAAHRR